jgi:hypothetical protein
LSKFVNVILGGLAIAAFAGFAIFTGGIGLALADPLIAVFGPILTAGTGMLLSGVGTLISGAVGGSAATGGGITTASRTPIAPWQICYAVYPDGGHVDGLEKLFQAGQFTAVGITGVSALQTGVPVSDYVAHICGKAHLQESPWKLLDEIQREIEPMLRSMFKTVPLPSSIPFGAFVVSKRPSGELDLLELEIPISKGDRGMRLAEPRTIVHAEGPALGRIAYSLGHGDYLTRGLEQRLDPDLLSDADIVGKVDEIFRAATVESVAGGLDDIGGPLAIAVIDQGGFRWVTNEPQRNCGQEKCLQ